MNLQEKIKKLPTSPGVYFHKDANGQTIYVGKAGNLRNRVKSYFQKSKNLDFKTSVMLEEIKDIDWVEVAGEVDALFLESAMIKRYQPKYNVLLRDDKQFLYVKITKDEFPRVSYSRRPLDDRAEYFGPFTSSLGLKKAMKQLRRSFPYVTHSTLPKKACLHYHIGLCPGPEINAVTRNQYLQNLRQIKRYLKGKGGSVIKDLEKQMKSLSSSKKFEEAAKVRDQLNNLKSLSEQHIFTDKELFDLSRDNALSELQKLLDLSRAPRRIECYDVSHIQGTNNTASMVVFTDGVPNRGEYRKFKLRSAGNNDYLHMKEVLSRRMKRLNQWGKPDVLVIDGGKGQVSAAQAVLKMQSIDIPVIGLAKRFETIIIPEANGSYSEVKLSKDSHLLKLLQHIRDEAHRFAVTYHSLLRSKQQTSSQLESLPGIGPATRKKLIKHFGSVRGVKAASESELSQTVGPKTAAKLKEYL